MDDTPIIGKQGLSEVRFYVSDFGKVEFADGKRGDDDIRLLQARLTRDAFLYGSFDAAIARMVRHAPPAP